MEEYNTMKLRRRRGATLGLVAVVVLVIAILGFGFFFLSKIMGGGREVANATDAGSLNVAKRALVDPTAFVPANSEFDGLGVNKTTGVPNNSREFNLLAYNRAVGRAMLIALNAKAIGSASSPIVQEVMLELKDLGERLQNTLDGTGTLPGYFTNIAGSANVKMMGPGSNVQLSGAIVPSWMVPADPNNAKTNVYIKPEVVQPIGQDGELGNYTVAAATIKSKGNWPQGFFTSASGFPFLRAYQQISFVNGVNIPLIGAAVGPQDRPHLVNLGEFNQHLAKVGYAPPNSWRTNSQSREMKSGSMGGAVACAVVGSLDAEYEACIPRGYIKIKNFDSAEVVTGESLPYSDVDGSESIFNKEFWTGPGGTGPTFYSQNGSVFGANGDGAGSEFAAWDAYNDTKNNPVGPGPNLVQRSDDNAWYNLTLDPLRNTGAPTHTRSKNSRPAASETVIRSGAVFDQRATIGELLAINGIQGNCDFTNAFQGVCDNARPTMRINFESPGPTPGGNSGGSPGATGVEYVKAKVIEGFNQDRDCTSVSAPAQPTGMKIKGNGPYNTPNKPVKFMAVGSPYALLLEVDKGAPSCAATTILNAIIQRAREIHPGDSFPVIKQKVIDALSSRDLPPGQQMYLWCDNSGNFNMTTSLPPGAAGDPQAATRAAEGTSPVCTGILDTGLNGETINSKAGVSGNPKGDTGIHSQPYTEFNGTPFTTQNEARWSPSCGGKNFLGQLDFSNKTEGSGNFCKPN